MARDLFVTTIWTRIREAQRGEDAAVWSFVELYRPALIRFFRAKKFKAEDAEDLVQEVFIRLFTKEALARADRERGRFRAFLVGISLNVMKEELQRRSAKKRGGGQRQVPLHEAPEIPVQPQTDASFDRLWAEQLLTGALDELEAKNPRQHETLRLSMEKGLSPQEISERIERTNQQVRNDLHRARKRIVKHVRKEILAYSSSKEEYEDDVALFQALVGIEEPSV